MALVIMKCIYDEYLRRHLYFSFSVEPKNPQIHGKINGKLDGQEGVHLQLLCTVTSGIPNETITWYNVSSKIDKGGPAILNTTITPSRYDHKKKYICSINHTSLQKPLQEIVTLDIKCEF